MNPTSNPPLINQVQPVNQAGNGMAQLAQRAARQRASYSFEVPIEIVDEAAADGSVMDIRVVNVRVLTPAEEKDAITRANGNPVQIAYEFAMACLVSVEVGGAVDDQGNVLAPPTEYATLGRGHEALALFNNMHMKVRDLLLAAYQDLHKPKEDQTKGFLASRKVRL